tara:strand:+ start:2742 stop:3392 length:651 start_codon:yes stop_codon:yes gene_type:complete
MPPDGRGGPHAFVADVDEPGLTEDDRHHLANVLRLRSGDALTVSDGLGTWRPCMFGAVLEPCGDPINVPMAASEVAVGFALIKGGRPEVVVQKLTELGVDRIVLLNAERSIVRWDPDKERHQMDRLGRVAREASMQSRRVRLPVLEGLASVASVVSMPGVAMAEPGRGPRSTRPARCCWSARRAAGHLRSWAHGKGSGLVPRSFALRRPPSLSVSS